MEPIVSKPFMLLSGIEAQVSEMSTGDKDLMLKFSKHTELIHKNLVRLGDLQQGDITREMVAQMLSADRALIRFHIRQVSYDYPTTMLFDYEFPIESKGKKEDAAILNSVECDLTKPHRPYGFYLRWLQENGIEYDNPEHQLKPMYDNYQTMLSEQLTRKIKLSRSGKEVQFNLLTGQTESQMSNRLKNYNMEDYLATFHLRMYQFKEQISLGMSDKEMNRKGVEKEEIEGQLKNTNIDALPAKDSAELEVFVQKEEGKLETLVRLQHPSKHSVIKVVNVMHLPAFITPGTEIG